MLYRFITSGYTDALAYASAVATALWMFVARQYAAELPGYLASVSPLYGLAVASFTGALLICKYICLEGNALTVRRLDAEKKHLEGIIGNRDQTVTELNGKSVGLEAEIAELRSRIVIMEENSPTVQLSELRKKLRAVEDDTLSALSVLVKNLQSRLNMMSDLLDDQLFFAADVLCQEIRLVESEIKRGEISYYELCLKIVAISENISELREIYLATTFDGNAKQGGSVAETWLKFIRENNNSDPAAVERAFRFFKVAFHPDKFSAESLKVEATRYFQHSIDAHNAVKRMDKAAQ
ncbi:MAG: hypothetical protein WCP20_23035 [Desulfuromonadales bacterium]